MEEDRTITNVEPDTLVDSILEPGTPSRQPRKRFIGGRAALERAAAKAAENGGTIEDSGALQGTFCVFSGLIYISSTNTDCIL